MTSISKKEVKLCIIQSKSKKKFNNIKKTSKLVDEPIGKYKKNIKNTKLRWNGCEPETDA